MIPYLIILTILTFVTFIAYRISFHTRPKFTAPVNLRYNSVSIIILIFAYIPMIIFSVYRVIDIGVGGIDAMAYKQYFLGAKGTWSEALEFQNYEIGYSTIVWIFRQVSDHYTLLLFFIYTMMFILLIKYVKYITWNKYTLPSVFLLFGMIISSFNTTRVILAVFIGLIVYIAIYNRKYLHAILLSVLAATIHVSAIILFPAIAISYLVNNKNKVNIKKLILYIVGIAMISVVSLEILSPYINNSKYHVYNEEHGIALQTYIIIFIVFILSILKFRDMIKVNSFNGTLITILPIGLIILPLQMEYSILYRMILYFLPIIYSLIPSLLKVYSIRSINTFYYFPIKIGLASYLLIRIYIFLTIELKSAGIPYINYLFN